MGKLYDPSAPKKATNLSINSDLLRKARALKINLSATLEHALLEKLADADDWSGENRNAIRAYNELVEEHGCFGEEYREY
jgi:antitoxin CcdA